MSKPAFGADHNARVVLGSDIEAIVFDGEGVVIDSEPAWDHGQAEFLRRRGIAYDRDRVKPLLTGTSTVDGARVLKSEYGLTGDVEELARERREIVEDLFATEVDFIPGFLEFFRRVAPRYRTCVATALSVALLDIVDTRLHIRDLFGGRVFTLADVGNRSKPDPAVFLYAAQQIAVEPAACLVIEDSPYGIEAARRAGMRCVGITTTYDAGALRLADAVIESFDDIELVPEGDEIARRSRR